MDKTPHQRKMGGLIGVCQVCHKKIKGSLHVSSNFIKHLKKEHPQKLGDLKARKEENRRIRGRKGSFVEDILSFICCTASPLSIIDDKSFKNLFPGKKIPSRRTIKRLLLDTQNKFIKDTIFNMEKVEYVCTTADVWSSGKKSFFGYTCHWLVENTLERKSVALACRRFKGTHSFDRITKLICEINKEFKIPIDKIVYTITDNGSNFVKAFKEFGVDLTIRNENESDEDSESDSDDQANIIGPQFQPVNIRLSMHFSCASHTLNLWATTDFNKIMDTLSQDIRDVHKRSFSRYK